MECRSGCGACCIEPSITHPIPGMLDGKPAGTACVNLDLETYECRIWGSREYPTFCSGLKASEQMCGSSRDRALAYLAHLEEITRPD